jgi:hypothetical protein
MSWIADLFTKRAPAVTPPAAPKFICTFHYAARIAFKCKDQHGILAGMGDEARIPEHEHLAVQLWHRPDMARDDILHADILRSCTRITMDAELRRYFTAESMRFESYGDRMMVIPVQEQTLVGYYAGHALTQADAMHYVATGDRARLVCPWKAPA